MQRQKAGEEGGRQETEEPIGDIPLLGRARSGCPAFLATCTAGSAES